MPSALVIKAIKPARFNDKAMTERLRYHAKKVAEEMKKDFEATTKTWQHKVAFTQTVSGGKGLEGIVAEVATSDEIYTYVDQGTKPHIIRPVHAKMLAFPSIFSPKTKPRVIGSGSGMKGPVDTFRQEVHHPGTEAREFSKTIEEKWQPRFRDRMQAAMKDAAKASGHSM